VIKREDEWEGEEEEAEEEGGRRTAAEEQTVEAKCEKRILSREDGASE
jgi:hypothetical protein